MTYAILSTTTGHLLESYRTEDRALEAAARIQRHGAGGDG
jgi:hypothetical protein